MVQETETIILHNYQTEAVNFVLDNIDNSNVLLAAAPNAGKTFMASFVINELIKNNKRVLCSVHGTNILKKQFYNSICEIVGFENISVYDVTDLSLYDSSKPVQVMIYQNIKQMEECVSEFGKFDYLIVDEAHKFYDGNNMETICSKFVIGNHLLLTGSPTTFKERVDSGEIVAKYISASLIESVHEGQYDKDIILDVVSNDVHLTTNDYNQDGEVISKSEHKLKNNELILDSLLVDDFGKTIIFVKQISQANKIERYLNKRNILNFISHSEVDKDSVNIYEFRNNYTGVDNVVLIVVGRATEGFDDPNVSIIDITYSKNVDTLYQRYSRAIRKRVDSVNKRYVKVVPNNDNSAEVFIHIMTAVLMLLKQEHYENFNGKNFSIPTLRQIVKTVKKGVGTVKSYVEKPKHETNDINDCDIIIKSSDEPQSVKDLVENDNFIVNVKIEDVTYEIKKNDYDSWVEKLDGKNYLITINKSNDKIDDELLMETKLYSGSFFDIKSELYGLITRYATNNLYDVLREINGEFYATEEEHIKFIKENNITGNRDYTKLYKIVKNLHSNPWIKFGNGSVKDYFESIWGKKEEFATEEEHIKFIKENNITGNRDYSKLYKIGKNLCSIPWKKFGNGSIKDYFESIWGVYATEEEHIKFIKENDIKSGDSYYKLYKSCKSKLYSQVWQHFGNGSSKDYFESIWGVYATEEEHIKFIKENDIKSVSSYLKSYKLCKSKLYSQVWVYFGNFSAKKYFENIWGIEDKYATEKEHIKFIKENDIKSVSSYYKLYKSCKLKLYSQVWQQFGNSSAKKYFNNIWEFYATEEEHIKFIKENNITGNRDYTKLYKIVKNLHSNPWIKFGNGSVKDYFESIWGKKEEFATEEEHIKFIKENNIKSVNSYFKLYKSCKSKLHSIPWKTFGNGSPKDYFKSIWESIEKEKIQREYKPAFLGEFSEMNKKWNTSNSKTTHKNLKKDKAEWLKYHELYSKARNNWDEIPYKVIANKIKNRPEWLVGDFGCGENLLSKEITNKVFSFDHIAIDETVTSCDLCKVPLNDEILDVVVFSLSLMGTNYKEYFKEAYRTLKTYGSLLISEPSTRWEDKEDNLKEMLEEAGFKIIGDIKHSDRFIYVDAIKY